MNTDIRLSIDFWQHPKTIKLERRLGLSGVKSLQILWLWAALNRENGILSRMTEEDIEIAAGWQGKVGEFLATLVELRWVDDENCLYSLHNWQKRNSYAAENETRGNKNRLSRLAGLYPDLYKSLAAKGCTGITREVYKKLTSKNVSEDDVERTLNER